MSEDAKMYVRLDPELAAELQETVEREERTKTTVVERALRDYIARSKAEARAAKQQAKSAQTPQAA